MSMEESVTTLMGPGKAAAVSMMGNGAIPVSTGKYATILRKKKTADIFIWKKAVRTAEPEEQKGAATWEPFLPARWEACSLPTVRHR